MLYLILRFFGVFLFKLLFRFHVTGKNAIPGKGGILIVSNHVSYLDPLMLAAASPRPLYFFAKSGLFKNSLFGWLIRMLHAFPVHQDRLDKDAIERAIRELKKGKALVVFPEGTRSTDDRIHPGQAGAGFFAVKAGVPVLPVYLRGTYEALPPGRRMIRPKKVSIHFGKPLFFDPSASPSREGTEEPTPKKAGRRQIYYQKIADQMMEAIQTIKHLTET